VLTVKQGTDTTNFAFYIEQIRFNSFFLLMRFKLYIELSCNIIYFSSFVVVEMFAMQHFSSPGHQQQQQHQERQEQLNHHQVADRDLPPPPPEYNISSSGGSNSLRLRFSHPGHLDSSLCALLA
jgi:hypothetical protein